MHKAKGYCREGPWTIGSLNKQLPTAWRDAVK
jgi:hypothetical protein